ITRDWTDITVRDREPRRYYWRDLRHRRGSMLLFSDGSRIRLPTRDSRLLAVFHLLDADALIQRPAAKLFTPWMFVRVTALGLLLGAGALWIFHWLIAQGLFPGPLPVRQMLFI